MGQLRQFLRHEWKQLRRLLVRYRPRRVVVQAGFTLLELLLVTVIIGTLSAMAAPRLERARTLAQVAAAISNIKILDVELAIYMEINFAPAASLATIGRSNLLDPWGNPFVYLKLEQPGGGGGGGGGGRGGGGGGGGSQGQARKDKFLVPLNSDYDLYSTGADGESVAPLSPPVSHDDIIRALDGAYVGLASEF